MHLPNDKVNVTWGQLENILSSFPEKLREIDRVETVNSCYQGNSIEQRVTTMSGQIDKALNG